MRTVIRWVGGVVCAVTFAWVFKVTDGNTLESISIAFKVMLVFLGIDIFIKYRNKKKERGLSEDQLWLQQSGSPDKLLKHGKIMRTIAYVLVVSSVGYTLFGFYISNVACILIGGGMCVIFLPCAAFFFWAAYKFISVAKRTSIAQAESTDMQNVYELSANSVAAISEDKKSAAFKELKRKSIEAILFFLGFFPFIFGLLLFSDSYIEQGYSLTPPQFSELHEANGIFKSVRSGRSHYFAVDDNQNNRRYSCDSGCGFEGSVEAIGKQAKVLVYKDSIYQLEIDNVVVVDYAKRIKFTSKYIYEGIIYATIGAFLFTLLPFYKRLQRIKNNGK